MAVKHKKGYYLFYLTSVQTMVVLKKAMNHRVSHEEKQQQGQDTGYERVTTLTGTS